MQHQFLKLIPIALFFILFSPSGKSQFYSDLFIGLHPQILNDGGASAHLNAAFGHQASAKLGYGLNIGTMAVLSVSTTSSFTTLGLQYRVLDNRHRFYGKAEIGGILDANYTTDGPFIYDYENNFNPYYRIYAGHRFGRFTMGINYTYISPFSETISEYDDVLDDYVLTDRRRSRNQHDLQLYIGLSLDSYKTLRRKN